MVVSVREAIARGNRQAALRLLRVLTLRGPQEAVDLTQATAEALVATAQAEPEERGRAALETYRAAEATLPQSASVPVEWPFGSREYTLLADDLERIAAALVSRAGRGEERLGGAL